MTPADSEIKGAGAIIKTTTGEFVFQERDEHAKIAPNKIGFFAGGREGGETIQETVIRELEEETRIVVLPENVHLVGYAQHSYDMCYSAIFFIDQVDHSKIDLQEGRSYILFKSLQDFLNDPKATKLAHAFITEHLEDLKNM